MNRGTGAMHVLMKNPVAQEGGQDGAEDGARAEARLDLGHPRGGDEGVGEDERRADLGPRMIIDRDTILYPLINTAFFVSVRAGRFGKPTVSGTCILVFPIWQAHLLMTGSTRKNGNHILPLTIRIAHSFCLGVNKIVSRPGLASI